MKWNSWVDGKQKSRVDCDCTKVERKVEDMEGKEKKTWWKKERRHDDTCLGRKNRWWCKVLDTGVELMFINCPPFLLSLWCPTTVYLMWIMVVNLTISENFKRLVTLRFFLKVFSPPLK